MFNHVDAEKLRSGIQHQTRATRQFGNSSLGDKILHGYAKFHTPIDDLIERLLSIHLEDQVYDLPIAEGFSGSDTPALSTLERFFNEEGIRHFTRNKAFIWTCSNITITDVSRVVVRGSNSDSELLSLDVGGALPAHYLHDAIWACYILGIQKMMANGSDACHLYGADEIFIPVANHLIEDMGATVLAQAPDFDLEAPIRLSLNYEIQTGTLVVTVPVRK